MNICSCPCGQRHQEYCCRWSPEQARWGVLSSRSHEGAREHHHGQRISAVPHGPAAADCPWLSMPSGPGSLRLYWQLLHLAQPSFLMPGGEGSRSVGTVGPLSSHQLSKRLVLRIAGGGGILSPCKARAQTLHGSGPPEKLGPFS